MKGLFTALIVAMLFAAFSCTVPITIPEGVIPEFEFVIGGEKHFKIRPLSEEEVEEIRLSYELENPLTDMEEAEWLSERVERVKLDVQISFSDNPDPQHLFPFQLQLFISPISFSTDEADILVDVEVEGDLQYTIDSGKSGGAAHLLDFFMSGEESRVFFFTLRHNFGAEFDGETIHATGTLTIEGTIYIRIP